MTGQDIPRTDPLLIATDTFLIPHLADGGPDGFVPVNSLLIRGDEPVIVDTGAPIHRDTWIEKVFSLVDPEDVRWLFLSHDDGDHTGALHDVLEMCPKATMVTNFFSTERLNLERALPLERLAWREQGDTVDAGDRTLRLVIPPIFDGPTTRGLFDERTGVLWAVDSFAALTPGAVHRIEDVPADMYDATFAEFNSLISPWHQWLDPVAYDRHVDHSESLGASVIASAHGPVLTGTAIHDAFDRVRSLAGQPRVEPPGQSALDEILAALIAG